VTPRRRRGGDPVPVGEALDEVRSELGLPSADLLASLRERWSEVVGADVADHVTPTTLRAGVLRVTVDDAIWATRLRYLAGDLLDRLDAIVGAGEVVRIHVAVVARSAPKGS